MESEEPSVKLHESLNPTLIKGLASCNAQTRSKSLKSLLNYLSSQTLISDDDFKKLWKALFYCMWHCDKIQNQTHLVNRVSHLLTTLPYPLSLSYFSYFLLTMRREWPGIDHLRLDKFYLLVRHFVRNLFVLMRNMNWDLCVLEDFVRVLEKNAFFYVDDDKGLKGANGLGNGVSYHIVCVFCEEIKPFLPLSLGVLNLLFRPFLGVLYKSDNKVLVGKVKGNVFESLIKYGKELLGVKKTGVDCDKGDDVVLFGRIALAMGFGSRFIELGSSEECVQGNRKVVFGLHEEFLKLEKERDSLGFEVSLPEVDDEVPQLIPINNGDMDIEVDDEKNKKSKKVSKEKKSKKKNKKNKDKNEGSINPSGTIEDSNVNDTEMVNVSDSSNVDSGEQANTLELNETMISNLQQQFEKIAAESGLDGDGESALESPRIVQVKTKSTKKRKRSKSAGISDTNGEDNEEVVPNTEDKSVKRVRFAMKNNIVWKPQNPLPPQSVRIPPSSVPRGSALKKGLSPGPIRDVSLEVKKPKKKKPATLKKAKKVKNVLPSKRVKKKKVKSISA